MNRRSFLQGIIAAAMAPAIVKAASLMPVRKIWTPPEGLLFPASLPDNGFVITLFDTLRGTVSDPVPVTLLETEQPGVFQNVGEVVWKFNRTHQITHVELHKGGQHIADVPLRFSKSVTPGDSLLLRPSDLKLTLE